MAQAGDVLELPNLGMKIVFRQTSAETDGALLEYDVIGRPRGFVVQGHVHPGQEERQEVVAGANGLALGKSKRVYGVGESFTVPPGTPHRHFPAGSGEGHIRVELRPALRTEEFLERLAELDRDGQITSRGWLKPTAAARMVVDFEQEGRASRPPVGRAARARRRRARARLASARTRPASTSSSTSGTSARRSRSSSTRSPTAAPTPSGGSRSTSRSRRTARRRSARVSRQEFKGKLPYHLKTTSTIVEYEPPDRVVADVVGDLRGRGVWTLTDAGRGRHARPLRLDGVRRPQAAAHAHARCCGRSSARTTTGRSPARWRAWSPTRSARTPVVDTNWPR